MNANGQDSELGQSMQAVLKVRKALQHLLTKGTKRMEVTALVVNMMEFAMFNPLLMIWIRMYRHY